MTTILIILGVIMALYIGYGVLYSKRVVRPWVESLTYDELKQHFAQMRLAIPLENENQIQAARLGYVASAVVVWPRIMTAINQWRKKESA